MPPWRSAVGGRHAETAGQNDEMPFRMGIQMTDKAAFADARASAARLWQIHVRFRRSLTDTEAAELERRTLHEPDFARELFEHLHVLSAVLTSCANEEDAEFDARDKPFLEGPAAEDGLFASLTRFVLVNEAGGMIEWMQRIDLHGGAQRARSRLAAMMAAAPTGLHAPTLH